MEFDEFPPMTYDEEDHHAVRLCTLRMELQTANGYAVLLEDEMEDIEAWDLDDMMYSSASDGESPLLVEVDDDDDVNKNSDGEDVIEDSSEGHIFTRIEEDPIRDFLVWMEEDEPEVTGINDEVDETVYEAAVLLAALGAGEELSSQKEAKTAVARMTTGIWKSSKVLQRPRRTEKEVRTFLAMVEINRLAAVALLDSSCAMDALSPELV